MNSSFFNQNLGTIPNIDIKKLPLLAKLGCFTIKDLLFHVPIRKVDRSYMPSLNDVNDGDVISQIVEVDSCEISKSYRGNFKKAPSKIHCSNNTGSITLVYFNKILPFIIKKFIPGNIIFISGKVEIKYGNKQMLHPDIVAFPEEKGRFCQIDSVYYLTQGITSRYLAMIIKSLLKEMPKLDEWLPQDILVKYGWYSFYDSLNNIHCSNNDDVISKSSERLAFDEVLAQQTNMQLIKQNSKNNSKIPIKSNKKLIEKLIKSLPFSLTNDQLKAIDKISNDQISDKRMTQLLIGDVGCGKTLVALCAILNVIEGGMQAALMVPTEILAVQHFDNIQKLLSDEFGIVIELLIGKTKKSERNHALENIENGNVDIIIGTQALFQDKVKYKNLGLAVIDEQHRFGVNQRLSLLEKGINCDLLMLSATPIPRTYYMVCYGDMDLTFIKEKPNKNCQISTLLMPKDKLPQLIKRIKKVMDNNERIYWICPLIQESEKLQLSFVEERHKDLKKELGDSVSMMHGQISQEERTDIMQKFKNGDIKLLVSTTVIEVGVDVKDATVIVIENPERFGLAQLHQLRGRIGRGEKDSYCILLYNKKISPSSIKRLLTIRNHNDGFYIAENDMKNRGAGDIAGIKQSGLPDFRIFNFYDYNYLLKEANIIANQLLNSSKSNELLNLFKQNSGQILKKII